MCARCSKQGTRLAVKTNTDSAVDRILSKPSRTDELSKGPEQKRIEPNLFLPGSCAEAGFRSGDHLVSTHLFALFVTTATGCRCSLYIMTSISTSIY